MGRIVVGSMHLSNSRITRSMALRSRRGALDHLGDLLGNSLEADNLTCGSGPQVSEEHDVRMAPG